MKKIFKLIILLSLLSLSCSENCVCPEEPIQDDGISWDQITGRLAYLIGNVLYLLDADSGSVKSLGATSLTNLKWNKTLAQITGIHFTDDSTYSLEGIDLNGIHSVLINNLSTKYYDWLPDGRLVTLSDEGKLLVDGVILLNQSFDPVFGLACSPDGNKIVVSTDNIVENLLLQIDINTLSQTIIERNLNLFDPNFEQPIYSLESDRVLYVTFKLVFRLFHPELQQYRVGSTSKKELGAGKDLCRSDNLQRIYYTKVYDNNVNIIGIYSIDIDDGNSVELVKGGHTPIWIY